ncbi:molybdate ABC transporter substrate-binding protein [Spongiimicrobium salis]|uniref:molybdate ABC transporter substrate-binding protein n=1 Tax=Spongiimicrobium salis TaxID=1667022 RepID=UPI00374CF725
MRLAALLSLQVYFMKNSKQLRNFVFIFLLCLYGCGQSNPSVNKVVIATAANMQFAMEALSKKFTESTKITCELTISSSGKLTAQIQEGAPYDVFVSANMKYPQELFSKGFTESPPKIYAYGQLVLWTTIVGLDPNMASLTQEHIDHIALANPKSAPYGSAAMEVLEHYKIKDQVTHKLVYGESISQANQFIMSQSADIGFTAMAVVRSPKIKDIGQWAPLNSNFHSPIAQGVVLIKRQEKSNKAAEQFYEFLFSDTAAEILKTYGYTIDE